MTWADPQLQQSTGVALHVTPNSQLCPDLIMRLEARHCMQPLTTADTDYSQCYTHASLAVAGQVWSMCSLRTLCCPDHSCHGVAGLLASNGQQ